MGFTWDTPYGPRDLTAWSGRLVARIRSDSAALIDVSTDTGEIVLGSAGEVDVTIPASVMAGCSWQEARYQLLLWPTDRPEDAVSFSRGRFVVLPAFATPTGA